MKQVIFSVAALLALTGAASANCYADYKAKQDNPLRLHYGVLEIRGACEKSDAKGEATARLAASGWTLLTLMGLFGPEGLDERKDSAGQYYLRF